MIRRKYDCGQAVLFGKGNESTLPALTPGVQVPTKNDRPGVHTDDVLERAQLINLGANAKGKVDRMHIDGQQ